MIDIGNKLICVEGNAFFVEGRIYTVGNAINEAFFEINAGSDGEYWYGTEDNDGIYVRFDAMKDKVSDARFVQYRNC